MPEISKPKCREIIDDFAKEIRRRRTRTAKPSKDVINFRGEKHVERDVYMVPLGLLRFRKENGRIASDVLDYERNIAILDERDDAAQAVIRRFLAEKDPEKTKQLKNSIKHDGQREPAVITCDGFLINGNRRKLVMDELHSEIPQDDQFGYMKVVILPGKDDEGGPPTVLEIERIENTYQLQRDGKSEYYGFDRALSIKRKIDVGYSLEDQLRDDPQYASASKGEFQKAVKKFKKDYLDPLDCVDKYLRQFGREGLYRTISTGMGDPEGRWQAFIDYSTTYHREFRNKKRLVELGIEDTEIGAIEEAAFDIIRLRTIPNGPKVHVIMRNLAKYCRVKEGKKAILKIPQCVTPVLLPEECVDQNGKPLSAAQIDAKWAAKYKRDIIYNLKKAADSHDARKEKETPLELLETAYKKLTHDDMDPSAIAVADFGRARKLAAQIKARANDLESAIYHHEKNYKNLTKGQR